VPGDPDILEANQQAVYSSHMTKEGLWLLKKQRAQGPLQKVRG
jgi:hypothetical protein